MSLPQTPNLLEKAMDIEFKNKELLLAALTHPSYLNENDIVRESYQRLEFLGDAVLEFITTEHIYHNFADVGEGKLTEIRAALVRTESLAECAQALNLGQYLFLSRGEELNQGRTNLNILADVFEAVLGASYLDSGLTASKKLFDHYVAQKLDLIIEKELHIDPKSHFQEIIQSKLKTTPQYRLVKQETENNETVFIMGAYISNTLVGIGRGRNKKQAEHEAAVNALSKNKFV